MRRLYVIVPGMEMADGLRQSLLSNGIEAKGMQMYATGRRSATGSPIAPKHFRPTGAKLLLYALAGCLVLAALGWAVLADAVFTPLGALGLSAMALAGLAAGAVVAIRSGPTGELKRLRREMGDNDLLLLLDVPDQRYADIENSLMNAHPEIRIMGSDPAGSPPFP